MTVNCETLDEAEPRALGFTYWFDALPDGEPYTATVRFVGRRADVKARDGREENFEVAQTVGPIYPGTGYVAMTTRVNDITPGKWNVTAIPVPASNSKPKKARRAGAAPAAKMPIASSAGTTCFAPVARVRAPGVLLGAWPALVGLGSLAALSVQAYLASKAGLPLGRVVLISLLVCLLGVLGAKIYYLLTHPGEKRSLVTIGMSIQGFVITAFVTLVVGAAAAAIPIGPLLDATTPGLMLGMTIGRLGCFFGGCCAGKPTGAPWGLWSSDRTVGIRRIPVQLFESAMAGSIAVASFLAVAEFGVTPPGVTSVAAVSAYILGRQLLFPLRSIPRSTTYGRPVMMAVAALALLGSVGTSLLWG